MFFRMPVQYRAAGEISKMIDFDPQFFVVGIQSWIHVHRFLKVVYIKCDMNFKNRNIYLCSDYFLKEDY